MRPVKTTEAGTVSDVTLKPLKDQYVPFTGFLDLLIRTDDSQVILNNVVGWIKNSNGQPINKQNGQELVDARLASLITRILQAYGNPKQGLQDIDDAIQRQQDCMRETEDKLRSYESEWKSTKSDIAGYAAEARLKAPKEFWAERGAQKKEEATKLKRYWHSTLIGLFILTLCAACVLWRWPASGTNLPETAGHFILFGSAASIAVWMSRQALKDFRLAEHISEDAHERVAMIETFARLKGEDLGGDGYQTILNAIFRSSTALDVDDAGPKLPIEIFVKTLTERAKV